MNKIKRLACVLSMVLVLISVGACKRTGILDPSPLGPSTYSLLLDLSVSPNVIFAGETRESTTIKATLKKFDGSALSGYSIFLYITDITGLRANVGYFDGNQSQASRTTDQNGSIEIKYHGPVSGELTGDMQLYVFAVVDWQGTDYMTQNVPLFVLRDVNAVTFELYAEPNVLYCTSQRPQSLIRAVFKKTDGTPLVNRRVYFFMTEGPGYFEDFKTTTFAVTNEQGIATIYYVGPTSNEIGANTFAQVKGQPETNTPFYMHELVDIRLLKGSN